jgi:hypothetical protein
MTRALILLALAAALRAQIPVAQPAPPANEAAVSGIVRDKGTGNPLAHYVVSTEIHSIWFGNAIVQSPSSRTVQSTTDETGKYRLSGLPAGDYRITVIHSERGFRSMITRNIALAGHDLEDINFDIVVPGTIKGKVLDENKEPVPDVDVMLVAREYYLGRLIYALEGFGGRTNDRGEYSIPSVEAGRPYMLLAERQPVRLPAHAETPLNPKLRRRVPMRTWYLNSPSADGATEVVLRAGEVREAVDIEMKKSPSYCAEGKMTAAGVPASLRFDIEAQQPSSGLSASGGMFRSGPGGQTGADGEFRICDLSPGTYRLTATNLSENSQLSVFGTTTISIGDQDLRDITVAALPGTYLEAEVALDGPVPHNPLTAKVSVTLEPLLRAFYRDEAGQANTRLDIPGTFVIRSVMTDDYHVRTFVNSPSLYIKDVTYGGNSVRDSPLRLGSTISDQTLRIIVGQDGAKLSATVKGSDSAPVPDINIVMVPAESFSDGALAANMVTGKTDQNGQYTSQTLAPGKYYIAATDEAYDASAASIARLSQSHLKFTEVTLAPNGQGQVTLQPLR